MASACFRFLALISVPACLPPMLKVTKYTPVRSGTVFSFSRSPHRRVLPLPLPFRQLARGSPNVLPFSPPPVRFAIPPNALRFESRRRQQGLFLTLHTPVYLPLHLRPCRFPITRPCTCQGVFYFFMSCIPPSLPLNPFSQTKAFWIASLLFHPARPFLAILSLPFFPPPSIYDVPFFLNHFSSLRPFRRRFLEFECTVLLVRLVDTTRPVSFLSFCLGL